MIMSRSILPSSPAGLTRGSTLTARGCRKAWMAGSSPAMTMRMVLLLGSLTLTLLIAPALAQSPPTFSSGRTFTEQGGEALYTRVCQGCHMQDGRGAQGAGNYPALANNEKLAASGYPLTVVLNGLHGMPPVGAMMSDQQVADVVNYVRSHFGNSFTDEVKAADVKAARPSDQIKSKDLSHAPQDHRAQSAHSGARHRYRPCCIYWDHER
jgi:mono/diheme cytochrome c family protein